MNLELISEYRELFLISFFFLFFVIVLILLWQAVVSIKGIIEDRKKDLSKEELMVMDYDELVAAEKAGVIRRMIAPDGINPGPDDHMIIYDSVKKVYSRQLTISKMAKRVNFANTFSPLFNFPDSTYKVLVEPIDEQRMSKKLDRHLVILESEFIAADGDSNRRRKLKEQYAETNEWAGEVETGKNKFFRVGFVFTLYADSLDLLTKASDKFRNLARDKGMDVSACIGVQSEAYIANAPLNNYFPSENSPVSATDGIFYHYMDKFAVSTIYNYTSCTFSHRDGVPLGRDRQTHKPVVFNPYHASFNGYTLAVVGKTGTGKSALLKMLASRCSLFNYRFASLDVQPRQGTGDGEYAGICDLLGGLNFELKNGGENTLNIFEVRETTKYVKTGIGRGYEKRALDLNAAISQSVNLIKIMIAEHGESSDLKDTVTINNVILDTVKRMFASEKFRIIDGEPDSLYIIDPETGIRTEKALPAISDFVKLLLQDQKIEEDAGKASARKIVLMVMEDYVRDLYYAADSIRFFEKKEFEELPVNEDGVRFYKHDDVTERVLHVHGTKGYFDGQSTVRYSPDVPWVNIDCSQLDEGAKKVAMSVGMNWINERVIKGNSESRDNAKKIIVIFDEAHMIFKIRAARELLEEIVRTARKRLVALAICTQTLREFDEFKETRAIRVNAAASFIFKQDYSDKSYLIETLGLTESEVDDILAQGGNLDQMAADTDEGELEREAKKHKGEVTIVINRTAIPVKVDYLYKTERYAVETNASETIDKIEKIA